MNSRLLPLFISYRSSGEKLIRYQGNSSCVIMSVILITTLFYKALISQGEIWCWSLSGLKGFKPQYPHENSPPDPTPCISFKNQFREFYKISKHFHFDDQFLHSPNLFSWWWEKTDVGRYREASPRGATPYPLIYDFWQEKYRFCIPCILPLSHTYSSLERCIPFNCWKFTVFKMWKKFQN